MRRPLVPRLTPLLILGSVLPAADLCGQDDRSRPEGRRRWRAPSQEELIARKAAALDKPFVHAANWFTDFSAAKAEARRTGKPIFAYFSRSYRP